MEHTLLTFFWVGYCVIHSVLADIRVKQIIEVKLGKWFRYYRLSYSIFAAISLGLLLWYHFSLNSPVLFNMPILQYVFAGLIAIPGLIIMIICINKYFYELSGVQALSKKEEVKVTLQTGGLHAYVRHPLYLGTLMLVWGLFILLPWLNNLIACLVMQIYILIGIQWEEKQLVNEFGEAYIKYSAKVPGLVPKLTKK